MIKKEGNAFVEQLISAVAVTLAVGAFAATKYAPPTEDKRTWIVFNMDSDYYENTNGPDKMNLEAIDRHVGERLDPGKITHFFVNPNTLEARYPSKVAEPCWIRQPWMKKDPLDNPRVRNIKLLNDKGIDRYAEFLKSARKRGVEGWISMRMNDVHGVDRADDISCSFWHDHPEYWVVPHDKSGNWFYREFDYAHREVREHHIAFAREMFDRWDMDGFEADWTRFPQNLTLDRERELSWCLTEVMRAIREKADEQEEKRGHRIYTSASVMSTPNVSLDLGLDAIAWAKERLIDVLFVCNLNSCLDFDIEFAEWTRLIRAANPQVRVVCRVNSNLQQVPTANLTLDAAGARGFFDNLFVQGCRDFSFFNWFERPTDTERAKFVMLRGLPREGVYAGVRRYPATFRDYVGGTRVNKSRQLPAELSVRRTLRITVGTASDAGKVVAEVAFAKPLAGDVVLKLNGVPSLTPVVVAPELAFFDDDRWNKHIKKPHGYRTEFPVMALKSGRNELTFPPVKGNSAAGGWLLVTPTRECPKN